LRGAPRLAIFETWEARISRQRKLAAFVLAIATAGAEYNRICHEHWKPYIAGELNGQLIKLVKFQGEFS
jgi:hypothetical protein